jgi:hypothetical protein
VASFKLERNGVPFTVRDVESQEDANVLLDQALAERPEILANKAQAVGLDFDFETNTASERSFANKFLIGSGRFFKETGEDISDIFSSDELEEQEIRVRENEARAFAALDDLGVGAEDLGEIAPLLIGTGTAGLRLAVGAVKAAGKGASTLLKIGSGLGLVGTALRTFVGKAGQNGVTEEVVLKARATAPGRAAIRAIANSTSPKQVAKMVDVIKTSATRAPGQTASQASRTGARAGTRPTGNQGVRDAQVRIRRDARRQEAEAAAKGNVSAEIAALNKARAAERAAGASEAAKAQASRQAVARNEAQRAARAQTRANVKEETRQAIRKTQTQRPLRQDIDELGRKIDRLKPKVAEATEKAKGTKALADELRELLKK